MVFWLESYLTGVNKNLDNDSGLENVYLVINCTRRANKQRSIPLGVFLHCFNKISLDDTEKKEEKLLTSILLLILLFLRNSHFYWFTDIGSGTVFSLSEDAMPTFSSMAIYALVRGLSGSSQILCTTSFNI